MLTHIMIQPLADSAAVESNHMLNGDSSSTSNFTHTSEVLL
jgi:hypothetical protein